VHLSDQPNDSFEIVTSSAAYPHNISCVFRQVWEDHHSLLVR
jgi:hypothetical protein